MPRRPCLPQPVWDAILASGGPPNFGGLSCAGKWFISSPYCCCHTPLSGFNHTHLLFYSLGGQKCETHLSELKSKYQQIALLSGVKGKTCFLAFPASRSFLNSLACGPFQSSNPALAGGVFLTLHHPDTALPPLSFTWIISLC